MNYAVALLGMLLLLLPVASCAPRAVNEPQPVPLVAGQEEVFSPPDMGESYYLSLIHISEPTRPY